MPPGGFNRVFQWDPTIILTGIVAFGLPLTLLVPGFSLWRLVPKLQVRRLHIFSHAFSWEQSNGILFGALAVFFCLFLELRKRKLNEMVDRVLTVRNVTEATLDYEQSRQGEARELCARLLAASTDHYEHLALLQDELRHRGTVHQAPPSVGSEYLLSE